MGDHFDDSIPASKRIDIFQILRKSIAPSQFKSFARILGFSEVEIEEICSKYQMESRVMVLLNIYETRVNSLTMLFDALTLMKLGIVVEEMKSLLR